MIHFRTNEGGLKGKTDQKIKTKTERERKEKIKGKIKG